MKQAHGHKLGMGEALQPLCLAQGAFLVEADSLPSLKGHHSTTRNWIVGIGQKEWASGREPTCGEQLQGTHYNFPTTFTTSPEVGCPFKFWNLLELDPSSCPQGRSLTFHLREQESCCLPGAFRGDMAG